MRTSSAFCLASLFCLLLTVQVNAQDTIAIYETATGNTHYTLLNAYDTTKVADSIPASFGVYGHTNMPTTPPPTTVSLPIRAADYYSSFNFPFTAVTNIRYGFNIVAAVIGPRALLVFNYDVYTGSTTSWRPFYDIRPCFENGFIQFGHTPLHAIRYYALEPLQKVTSFAVIEVEENIGDYSGYFGLAFDTSLNFQTGPMLYNISAPSEGFPPQYPTPPNGDTLFLKYGHATQHYYNIFDFGIGRNGEYVSPFFDENFQVRGLRYTLSQCYALTPKLFYFLKQILTNIPNSLDDISKTDMQVFPNPATNYIQVKSSSEAPILQLQIVDALGKKMMEINNPTAQQIISIENLATGIYILQARTQNGWSSARWVKE